MASLAGIAGTATSTTQTGRSSPDPVQQAFKRANQRLEAEAASTQVQISAYGLLKAAFSEVQSAASTLTDDRKTLPVGAVKKAVQNLAGAYNKAIQSVRDATDTRQAGSLAGDDRARAAANELQRTLTANDNFSDLKKVGITRGPGGDLKVDAKALDRALTANPEQTRGVLARNSQRLERTASSELANNGNIGNRIASLNARTRTLETRQAEQQETAKAVQRTVETQATQLSVALNNGIAAYQRTFQG